ncbi:Regulatory protein BlaR1 [Aquisphaera giovannonii]|uniref:Regulatory protein BlaR1 n=1 Tax=Aquisphaera giovannonii TaxID=406548 RepID=A0A5B9W4E3_9BACT|nr:M56 family metallopeptidase [Aquisphaera giovannonii]QEH35428.1 Regulatory protein BlaR1 [Aquisphaera giovannonii]
MSQSVLTLTTALAGPGLTWLVQSTALLVLGLAAGRLLRRCGPAVQSAVYRTTLAAVLVCPIASALLASAGYEGLAIRLPEPAAIEDDAPPAPEPVGSGPARRSGEPRPAMGPEVAAIPPTPAAQPEPARLPSGPAVEARVDPVAPMQPAAPPVPWGQIVPAVVLAFWLIGSTVLAVRLLVGHRRMARLRAAAVPAGADAESLCGELAAVLAVAPPEVLRSPFLPSPCLDGLRRPAILIPEGDDAGLRETFAHELAHLSRRDGLWNLLRRVAVAAGWVQPLLWMLSRRIEAAAEEVCDDVVVHLGADRAHYAGHLLELAGRSLPPVAPAGVGMISLRTMLARRVVRILDDSRSLSTRVGTLAVAATLAAGLCGTLLAGMLGVGGRDAATGDAKESGSGGKVTRGRVVGPDGRPVPGAKVTAWRSHRDPSLLRFGKGVYLGGQYEYVKTTADSEGRFEVADESAESDAKGRGGMSVLATAPGFGAGVYLDGRPIRLAEGDQPVDGRVVDLEGRPVPGAVVRLLHVWLPDPEARREADARGGPYRFPSEKSLGMDGEPLLPGGVVTDAEGRFHIEGLGRDVMALVEITGPSVALKRTRIVARDKGPIEGETHTSLDGFAVVSPTYGARDAIPVEPSRPIEGVVRDLETNEPIPGTVVTAHRLSGEGGGVDGLIRTETDAQGRYRLVGLPKAGAEGHQLAAYPPLDRPYFVTQGLDVPASPGLETARLDIPLRRAAWASGTVRDARAGKPIEGAFVDYFPMISNERARDYPNFDPQTTSSLSLRTAYRTDADGRFRIPVLPGRGVVTARVEGGSYRAGLGAADIEGDPKEGQLNTYNHIFSGQYHGLKEIDVPGDSPSFPCDLALDPGDSYRVRIVDPDGKPVTTAAVTGRLPGGADLDTDMYGESVATDSGFEPGEKRTFVAHDRGRKLGAMLVIPPDGSKDGDEITLTLRPTATVTGRLVDEAGKPASGLVDAHLDLLVKQAFGSRILGAVPVGVDGRFRYENLAPGGIYELWLVHRQGGTARVRMKSDPYAPFALAEKLSLEPGQVLDLGTFNVATGKRIAAVEPPRGATVPITGRIVDLEGRPVAGASVEAGGIRVPKSGSLTAWLDGVGKGQAPWIAYEHIDGESKESGEGRKAVTDAGGRFRIEGLNAECVVELTIRGEAIATARIEVATRKMNPLPAPGFPNQYGPGSMTIYGADFVYTAVPGRPIVGVITDKETGKPLAGVGVRSDRFAGSDFVGTATERTETDASGRFRLVGMPRGKGNQIVIVPGDDQPYLVQTPEVPDAPGVGPASVELALPRGVWIEGTLTEKATGKPVAGAWLHYMPFLENRFAQAHPSFHSAYHTDNAHIQDRYVTKADGSFRLVGLPGRAIVGAVVHRGNYLQGAGSEAIPGLNKSGHFETYGCPVPAGKLFPTVMKEINPPADAKSVRVDLQATTGPSVRLRVVDAEGKPVTGASTRGLTGRASHEAAATTSPEIEAGNLMPGEERLVLLRHAGRKIGKIVRVREKDDAKGPVVVTLEPLATFTGTVADADGAPVQGARVRTDLLPGGDFSLSLGEVATDEKGRFVVADVPAGCEYAMVAESVPSLAKMKVAFLKKATVRPGETTDVGVIQFGKD